MAAATKRISLSEYPAATMIFTYREPTYGARSCTSIAVSSALHSSVITFNNDSLLPYNAQCRFTTGQGKRSRKEGFPQEPYTCMSIAFNGGE